MVPAAIPWALAAVAGTGHDTMGPVDVTEHISALEREGTLLADAANAAGLDAPVPPCPGWQVRDLVRHVAYVHTWAARHVREQLAELIDEAAEDDILGGGPPDTELIASYEQGHAALVRTLRDADPGITCATFMPAPSPLAFWARRQAHETAIHRFDAQAAAPAAPGAPGAPAAPAAPGGEASEVSPATAFDPAFADDGIDELIMGFAVRRRYRLRGEGERSLAVRAADTGGRWHVRLADGHTTVERGDHPTEADCVLEGPASGLYVYLWNRADSAAAGVTATGDPSVLDLWGSSVRVRW
jgi:uncharacterized protein (TIGR03083 family)